MGPVIAMVRRDRARWGLVLDEVPTGQAYKYIGEYVERYCSSLLEIQMMLDKRPHTSPECRCGGCLLFDVKWNLHGCDIKAMCFRHDSSDEISRRIRIVESRWHDDPTGERKP